jgi:hypothetical protein
MKRMKKPCKRVWLLMATTGLLLMNFPSQAQTQASNGSGAISSANTAVQGYFDVGCNLMYTIGAVAGLIGAIKVYQKWNQGDHDTGKVAAAWFGSCIFLVIVATVLKAFFGVS